MKNTLVLVFVALLTLSGWSEPVEKKWEAVCTTDTDIVFSIKTPEPLTAEDEMVEFWMRVWRPDKTVQDYQLQMWKDKTVQILKSPQSETPLARQPIPEGSPLEKIHLRVFDKEAFEKWDDQLEPMGPRGEELYEDPSSDNLPNPSAPTTPAEDREKP